MLSALVGPPMAKVEAVGDLEQSAFISPETLLDQATAFFEDAAKVEDRRFDGLPVPGLIAHEDGRLGRLREILRRVGDSADGSVPVVLVGDFDAPSPLDWPDVTWPVTKAAEEAGLRDSCREAHPDPVRRPRTHLVARPHRARGRQQASGTAGPDRFRPAPGPDRSRLPHPRQRNPVCLARRRGQRLALRPRGGRHRLRRASRRLT